MLYEHFYFIECYSAAKDSIDIILAPQLPVGNGGGGGGGVQVGDSKAFKGQIGNINGYGIMSS